MAPRLELQDLLEEVLGSDLVYFQPPDDAHMQYPCIVYERDRSLSVFADNSPYKIDTKYQLTYVSKSPDSETVAKLRLLERCIHLRFFVANKLNHDVFTLYF